MELKIWTDEEAAELRAATLARFAKVPRAKSVSVEGDVLRVVLTGAALDGSVVEAPMSALHTVLPQLVPAVVSKPRISPSGEALLWPENGTGISVSQLLEAVTGVQDAFALRSKAGSARMAKKSVSARANGAKGGRPRKISV
ncbi:MAG TPA: hypothetical protein VF627_14405 [Abditibacterium sp.]|jgi:hypothetical protein